MTVLGAPPPTEHREAPAPHGVPDEQHARPELEPSRRGRRRAVAVGLAGLALAAGALAVAGPLAGAAGVLVAVFATLLTLRLSGETRASSAPAAARAWAAALALAPGAATVHLAFSSGGFFGLTFAVAGVVVGALLLTQVILAADPFEGLGVAAAVAAGALTLFAAWALASGAWSGAPGRAFTEAARTLLYLLTLLLFASFAREGTRLRLMLRGLALGIVAVCVLALLSRLLPEMWPVPLGRDSFRLSYPLTYSNAVGLLAALGTVLCVHLASDRDAPGPIRVWGAAALPVLATVLLLTLSRGAIAAGLVGLAVLAVLARPCALPSALLAAVAPAWVAVAFAYRAELLFTDDHASALALSQGRAVAVVLVLCALGAGTLRALLLPLDAALARMTLPARARVPVSLVSAAVAVAAVVALGAALEVPARATAQYERFLEPGPVRATGDQRGRLTDLGSNFRLAYWQVAVEAFRDAPARGRGAGTYELLWARDRPVSAHKVADAHSLYLETAAELGVVGLVLIGTALLAVLAASLARVRGAHRAAYAAVAAVLVTWLVHAGLDWDWEMPAVTVPVFALGGAVLARARRGARPDTCRRPPRRRCPGARAAAALACVLLTAPLAVLLGFEARLHGAVDAERAGDCEEATARADSARALLDVRPEPYRLLAVCHARAGSPGGAVGAYAAAARRDPGAWRDHYALALARAAAGLDPRRAARRARRLNPRHPWSTYAGRLLVADDPEVWRAQALFAPGAHQVLGGARIPPRAPRG